MKRLLLAFVFLLSWAVPASAKVVTLQVTIGATLTQVLSAGAHLQCRWIVFQNNAAHNQAIGDSSTNVSTPRGILLSSGTPGGSFFVGPDSAGSARDLGTWYVSGTQNDILSITYDDGQ